MSNGLDSIAIVVVVAVVVVVDGDDDVDGNQIVMAIV